MESNTETTSTRKQCQRCGKTFECRHSAECWCFSYSVSEANLALIKNTYTDCLCEDCLAIFAKPKTNPHKQTDSFKTC